MFPLIFVPMPMDNLDETIEDNMFLYFAISQYIVSLYVNVNIEIIVMPRLLIIAGQLIIIILFTMKKNNSWGN